MHVRGSMEIHGASVSCWGRLVAASTSWTFNGLDLSRYSTLAGERVNLAV